MILREIYFGAHRFNELANHLGLSRNILTNRLRTLVKHGILEERPYGPSEARKEYRLSDAGRDIYPIIVALLQWGDKHLPGARGPSIILKHTRCGQDADPQWVCRSCKQPIDPAEILPTPGPGASRWVRERLSELPEHAPQR